MNCIGSIFNEIEVSTGRNKDCKNVKYQKYTRERNGYTEILIGMRIGGEKDDGLYVCWGERCPRAHQEPVDIHIGTLLQIQKLN